MSLCICRAKQGAFFSFTRQKMNLSFSILWELKQLNLFSCSPLHYWSWPQSTCLDTFIFCIGLPGLFRHKCLYSNIFGPRIISWWSRWTNPLLLRRKSRSRVITLACLVTYRPHCTIDKSSKTSPRSRATLRLRNSPLWIFCKTNPSYSFLHPPLEEAPFPSK